MDGKDVKVLCRAQHAARQEVPLRVNRDAPAGDAAREDLGRRAARMDAARPGVKGLDIVVYREVSEPDEVRLVVEFVERDARPEVRRHLLQEALPKRRLGQLVAARSALGTFIDPIPLHRPVRGKPNERLRSDAVLLQQGHAPLAARPVVIARLTLHGTPGQIDAHDREPRSRGGPNLQLFLLRTAAALKMRVRAEKELAVPPFGGPNVIADRDALRTRRRLASGPTGPGDVVGALLQGRVQYLHGRPPVHEGQSAHHFRLAAQHIADRERDRPFRSLRLDLGPKPGHRIDRPDERQFVAHADAHLHRGRRHPRRTANQQGKHTIHPFHLASAGHTTRKPICESQF